MKRWVIIILVLIAVGYGLYLVNAHPSTCSIASCAVGNSGAQPQ